MRAMSAVDIPAYLAFLPAPLLVALARDAEAVPAVPGLLVTRGLQADFPDLESPSVLVLVLEVYQALRSELATVLAARTADRAFIDATTLACAADNVGRSIRDAAWQTVIGRKNDEAGWSLAPSLGTPIRQSLFPGSTCRPSCAASR